jgi:hypothetical protein
MGVEVDLTSCCNHNSQQYSPRRCTELARLQSFPGACCSEPMPFQIRNCPCITIRRTPYCAWIIGGKLARCPNNWPKAAVVGLDGSSRPGACFPSIRHGLRMMSRQQDYVRPSVHPSSMSSSNHWSPQTLAPRKFVYFEIRFLSHAI